MKGTLHSQEPVVCQTVMLPTTAQSTRQARNFTQLGQLARVNNPMTIGRMIAAM
jgi:hypothetical protein